jgi:geranylgeranyl diphosphate synthase type II
MPLEQTLQRLLDKANISTALRQAAYYSLFPGGKRFRPQLALNIASLYGPLQRGWDVVCSLETLHTYSLIHDDLPCLDNDDLRRGKPSLHKAFGEATALLTGDFLLTWSFEILARAENFTSDEKIQLIQVLTEASGGEGMVGGQLLELTNTSPEELFTIYRGKTGMLIEAAVLFGGIIGKAPDLDKLKSYGRHLGLAFQLRDDLDDHEQDQKSGKLTLSTCFGKEKVGKWLEDELQACQDLSLFQITI